MAVIAQDLTERRAMVARTAAADRMLAHATLAAGVAHEINGPLAFLITNLSILADELPGFLSPDPHLRRRSRADIEHLLHDAQEGAMRVREVVRDLRLLARPAEEADAHCDLGAVLSSCARMAWQDVDGRARLVTDIQDLAPVRPDGTEIRLTARRLDPTHVLVEVADTGVGMAPEVVARVFEPFFTTKPAGIGTGLGLAICRAIIASLGGTISVESELGRGTRWTIVLQVAGEPRDSARPVDRPCGRRGRILVVDDDPVFARSLKLLLDEHEVVTFTSASLALAQIRDNPSFHLVLCDLTMPDVNGMEFYARVAELAPALARRIIFVTGGALTPEGEAFLSKNANTKLEKPFDPGELTSLVSRLVAESD